MNKKEESNEKYIVRVIQDNYPTKWCYSYMWKLVHVYVDGKEFDVNSGYSRFRFFAIREAKYRLRKCINQNKVVYEKEWPINK